MEYAWLLYIDRKGEITTRLFKDAERAKEAAEAWWKDHEWWHDSKEPLTWEDTDTQCMPHSDEFAELCLGGGCQILIDKMPIE